MFLSSLFSFFVHKMSNWNLIFAYLATFSVTLGIFDEIRQFYLLLVRSSQLLFLYASPLFYSLCFSFSPPFSPRSSIWFFCSASCPFAEIIRTRRFLFDSRLFFDDLWDAVWYYHNVPIDTRKMVKNCIIPHYNWILSV